MLLSKEMPRGSPELDAQAASKGHRANSGNGTSRAVPEGRDLWLGELGAPAALPSRGARSLHRSAWEENTASGVLSWRCFVRELACVLTRVCARTRVLRRTWLQVQLLHLVYFSLAEPEMGVPLTSGGAHRGKQDGRGGGAENRRGFGALSARTSLRPAGLLHPRSAWAIGLPGWA